MFKVIYLTGAPAAGKSTLCNLLCNVRADVTVFSYGEAMSNHLSLKRDRKVSRKQLRAGIQEQVAAEDIELVDRKLLKWVKENRDNSHLLVDAHQVTLERHGLSLTPFAGELLLELAVDEFWLLTAPSHTVIDRIAKAPIGRRQPSVPMADLHAQIQASVCTGYALATGRPMFVLDESSGSSALDFALTRLSG